LTVRAPLAVLLLAAACAPVPLPREAAFHASDAALAVTRVVHGSFILSLHGTNLLLDPWFYSGVLTRQREPLGLRPESLPPLAAVLVTGDTPGRFDARGLGGLVGPGLRAIAPLALRRRVLELGLTDVAGLAWWESTTVNGITITAVPASRGPDANGYVVASGEVRVFVAGETSTVRELVDVAVGFPRLDVAILPIGGRRAFGRLREMTPEQAADAAATLGASRVIPSGYGARSRSPWSWYAGDALERFRAAMAARGLADRLVVLDTGESWHYAKP
jgi:L-ascorbate metabolism protein UlaG (beta-lactamase superfamily)